MFEKEAEEYGLQQALWCSSECGDLRDAFQDGAEFGYNKAKEDVKYNLMMKLKDEGIVKPLKDSIFRNERLSSQEQQELCAWIECAMDFGENLDECAKELEEANKTNEWHYVKDGDLPKDGETVLVCRDDMQIWTGNRHSKRENSYFWYIHNLHGVLYKDSDIYAWKEIVLPELTKFYDLS